MDISFYAFNLPFYRCDAEDLHVHVAVALCFMRAGHPVYIFGGIRLTGRAGQDFEVAARAQLAVIAGVFVLLKAGRLLVWTGTPCCSALTTATARFSAGASYTDLNAVLPAKLILLFISLICAAAFFAAVFRQNLQLPSIAIALLVLSSVLVGAAWPAVLQQFVVKPNANTREALPIARNIEATQQAYGLTPDKVAYQVTYDSGEVSNPTSDAGPWRHQPTAVQPAVAGSEQADQDLHPAAKAEELLQLPGQAEHRLGSAVNGNTQDYVVAARDQAGLQPADRQPDQLDQRAHVLHARLRLRRGYAREPGGQRRRVTRPPGHRTAMAASAATRTSPSAT